MSATTIEIPLKLEFENRPVTSTAVTPPSQAKGLVGACGINWLSSDGFLQTRPPLEKVTTNVSNVASLFAPGPSEMYATDSGGNVYYSSSPGVFTPLGAPTTSISGFWASSSLPQNVVFNAGHGLGYYRNGATWAAITDATFTSLSTALQYVVCLDGTYYVMTTDGSIYGSNLNDGSTWSALNRINAWQDRSAGVALIKHRSFVVALKETSMQAFYDAGNAVGSPLLPMLQAQQPVGCIGSGLGFGSTTVVEIRGDHFWVARSPDSAACVVRMNNLVINVVSPPSVNRWLEWQLRQSIPLSAIKISCWGKLYYAVSGTQTFNGTATSTLVYDIEQNEWSFWENPILPFLTNPSFGTGFGDTVAPDMYYTNLPNPGNNIYKFVPLPYRNTIPSITNVIWADFTGGVRQAISNQFTTTIIDGGTQAEKTAMRLEIFSDNSHGGALEIQWSDDDYQTWSAPVVVPLTDPRAFTDDLGVFRRRAFRFRSISPVPVRLKAMKLNVLVGSP